MDTLPTTVRLDTTRQPHPRTGERFAAYRGGPVPRVGERVYVDAPAEHQGEWWVVTAVQDSFDSAPPQVYVRQPDE